MANLLRLFLFVLVSGVAALAARADDWPQWRGPQRDGVWRETGLVEHFAADKLKLRWRVPLGSGYSGPTVADGRVYVTDRLVEPKQVERIHAFDWRDGKTLWSQSYDCEYSDVGYTDGPRASVSIDDGRAYAAWAPWATCSVWTPPRGTSCGRKTWPGSTRSACPSGASPHRRSSKATCSSPRLGARRRAS